MKSLKLLFVLISAVFMSQWTVGQMPQADQIANARELPGKVKNVDSEFKQIAVQEKYPIPLLDVNQKH